MIKQSILYLLAVFQISLLSAQTSMVSFYEGNFSNMQAEAKIDKKPYFIAFTTAECDPCSKMVQQTFADDMLAEYINLHYLAYQIRVDSYRGEDINLAQEYQVMFYPTIILFSSEGEVEAKFTGFKAAEDFLPLLEKYKVKETPSREEKEDVVYEPMPATPTKSKGDFPPPIIKDETSSEFSEIEFEKAAPSVAVQNLKSEKKTSVNVAPVKQSNSSLFRISVSQHSTNGYGLQLGVYREYKNVIKEVRRLENDGHDGVLVNFGSLLGKPVFKVVVGPFNTEKEAELYKANMEKKEDRKGMVVDLSKYGR